MVFMTDLVTTNVISRTPILQFRNESYEMKYNWRIAASWPSKDKGSNNGIFMCKIKAHSPLEF